VPLAALNFLKTGTRISMHPQFKASALFGMLISTLVFVAARGEGPATQPATQPAAKPDAPDADQDYVISPMRVQELKGMTYLYISSKTSLAELGDHIRQSMEKIEPALKSGQVKPIGAALIIYHGVNQDPSSEFPLEVGFPVAADTKAADGFSIEKLDKFRCATVIYSGSMQQIHHAYEAVYNDLLGEGLEPTDEGRQAILMFEGPDSVNNVAMIEVGVR
jgi:predicted transcriptional regulator YdeE